MMIHVAEDWNKIQQVISKISIDSSTKRPSQARIKLWFSILWIQKKILNIVQKLSLVKL